MTGDFKADPKKYAELSKPFESREKAEEVSTAFFNAVAKLREQYRIPELVIQFEINIKDGDDVLTLRGGGGWGDQLKQAKLMKDAADREFEHLTVLVHALSKAMPAVRKGLLTDPVAEPSAASPTT